MTRVPSHRRLRATALGGAALIAYLALPSTALAQTEAPRPGARVTGVEEIVVTARRVEETSQSVPVAITALSEGMLERRDITRLGDIKNVVPNLIFDANTATTNAARIFLRGLGEDESFFTADMPVGIYIDDVYIPRSNGALFDLYNIQRMEVLRGPQGTLFGRNTTAGAIQVISKKPSDQFEGSVELTIGEYERFDVRAALGGPIVPGKVAGQVAVLHREQEGWLTDLASGQKFNGLDVNAGRASVLITPNEKLSVLLSGDYTQDHSPASTATAMALNLAGGTENALRQFPRLTLQGNEDVRVTRTSNLVDPRNDTDAWGLSGQIAYELGDFEIKSITAHRQMTWDLFTDFDGSNLNPFSLYQDQDQENTSQEIRFSGPLNDRVSIIGGFFYFNEQNEQITRFLGQTAPVTSTPFNYSYATLDTDSYAVFLSGTVDLTADIRLTAGARYTWETKDYYADARAPNGTVLTLTAPSPLLPGVPVGTPARNSLTGEVEEFNPSASIDWQVTEDALLYASIRNGFKGASFNGRLANAVAVLSATPLRPEKVWAYEAGAKTEWLDNRLRVNAAAFYTEVEDWQRAAFVNNNFQRGNQGDIYIQGLELETTAVLAEGFEVNGFLGVMDAGYDTIKFGIPQSCNGVNYAPGDFSLVSTPDITLGIGGNYTFAVPGLPGNVTITGNGSYKSENQTATCPHNALKQEANWLVDANVAYETDDGRYRLYAGVKNLTDAKFNTGSSIFLPTHVAIYYNPPRMWSAGIRAKF